MKNIFQRSGARVLLCSCVLEVSRFTQLYFYFTLLFPSFVIIIALKKLLLLIINYYNYYYYYTIGEACFYSEAGRSLNQNMGFPLYEVKFSRIMYQNSF